MTLITNQIEEIAPGVFWVMLWCPTSSILHQLMAPSGFVLCWDHHVGDFTWREARLPVLDLTDPILARSRSVKFDFLLPTEEFAAILPRMRPAIKAVQLSELPPNYLDMNQIKNKDRYRILQECGWHVLLDTPANDYGVVMSPHREVLERAIVIVGEAS